LQDATLRNNAGGLVEESSWQYDLVGNRLRQSLDSNSTYWHYNNLNQMDRHGGAGPTMVEGTVNEPAIVEVSVNSGNFERAIVLSSPGDGDFVFRREVEVNQGLNTIDVYATDASGNTSPIKSYELNLPAEEKSYEYDLSGNLRYERDASGSVLREFRWDARNRLTHIVDGANETEFEYDGQDRRRRIIERFNGVEQSNKTYLWVGSEILQKRNDTSERVLRDYYWFGFSEGANDYFYTRDHLGNVREVIASNGNTIESRYDYDLWGKVTRAAGTGEESNFLYTGHFYHPKSDLHLAQYRAYDSELGRWLSRDPIAENGGINLYAYVLNDPVNYVDPTGEIAFVPILVGIGVSMALDYLYDEYLSDHVNDYIDDNFDCKTQQGIRMAGTAAEIARSVKNPVKAAKNLKKLGSKSDDVVKKRKTKGRDGGESEHILEKDANGNTISKTHRVTKDGEVIHQHQSHIGKDGSVRNFPDEWTGTKTINDRPIDPHNVPQGPRLP
jgi:RHS repeat-associated protein